MTGRGAMLLVLVGGLTGCGDEVEPDCARMCVAATELYGECLSDWELDWAAAGYAGPGDFEEGCRTWAWEMGELEQDAVDRDALADEGALARACRQRHADFTAAEASCETYTAVDWARAPWESAAEDAAR